MSVNGSFAPKVVGRESFIGIARPLTRYKSYARYGAMRRGGTAEDRLCQDVTSTEANDLGIRDCSSARRNLSSRSMSGRFESA
jgi:hypothetical protein